jgi:hypothetical protein
MDDKHANKYVDQYWEAITNAPHKSDEQRRYMRLLVKEVERDTRHKATDLAQRLCSEISNLDHSK